MAQPLLAVRFETSEAGVVGAEGDEETGGHRVASEKRQQVGHTFLQAGAGIDIDFDGKPQHNLPLLTPGPPMGAGEIPTPSRADRRNHAIVFRSPTPNGTWGLPPRRGHIFVIEGTRRRVSSYPVPYTSTWVTNLSIEWEPEIRTIASASSLMLTSSSVPMFTTSPTAVGFSPATTVARIASSTYVKQRVCKPLPVMVSASPLRSWPTKIGMTRPILS